MLIHHLLRLTAAFAAIAVLALPLEVLAFQKGYPLVESTGTVYRVVDGDTFIINLDDPSAFAQMYQYAEGDSSRLRYLDDRFQSIRVRLANIDTPESVHNDVSRNSSKGRMISQKAKELLEGQRTQVSCFDWGNYGRAICSITKSNGRDYGEWLISEGYSPYVTRWGRNPIHHERYVRAAR